MRKKIFGILAKMCNKKNLAVFTSGLLTALCVSCNVATAKHPYTLTSDYAAADLSGRKFVVLLPTDERITINNKKDVVNDLGGANAKPESRIRKFYFPLFFEELKSLVSSDSFFLLDQYRPGLTEDSLAPKQISLQTGEPALSVSYLLPDESQLQAHGLDSSILILIERIEFKRNEFYVENYWDIKSRRSASLEADAIVLIWDCKSDKPVFYGPISEKTEFVLSMQRKHWEESARELAKKIVQSAKCL
jgi:hypothetical protein